jgi:ATP-binding cassette subfamily F protein uup
VFEGDGRIGDYAGGYTDWMQDKAKAEARTAVLAAAAVEKPAPATKAAAKSVGRKLTGKEQKELEALPAKIEALEKEQAALTAQLADPSFYRTQAAKFAEVKARLDTVEKEHATVFARWEELEAARN